MYKRLVNFLLGEDQAVNALGGGKVTETVSDSAIDLTEGGPWA